MLESKHESTRVTFSVEQLEEMEEDMTGGCIICGAIRDDVEPDACKYTCDECDCPSVYGPFELALMGYVN